MTKKLLSLLLCICAAMMSAAQSGCPSLDIVDEVTVDCDNPCIELTPDFNSVGETTTYTLEGIPYDPPFPLNDGASLFIGIDDSWSGLLPIPFPFCFFGDVYEDVVVGSNGVLTFNEDDANGYCPWNFDETAPDPNLITNAIFAPYMDIDPSDCGQVRWTVLGSPPCRAFVVNYDAVCLFSCGGTVSSQIVLYEGTNVIDIYIQNKPTCTWNDGASLIGIQNALGTLAYVPAGRNTGNWSANNEAYRFTPSNGLAVNVTWTANGEEVGVGETIEVCPTEDTLYEVTVDYGVCGANVVLTDQVMVIVESTGNADADPTILTEPFIACFQDDPIIVETVTEGGTFDSDCPCFQNGVINPLDVFVYGTYELTYTVESDCGPVSDVISFDIVGPEDADFTLPEIACDSENVIELAPNMPGGTFSSDCVGCLNEEFDEFLPFVPEPGIYTVTYTLDDPCLSNVSYEIVIEPQANATITAPDFICSEDGSVNLQANQDNGFWDASCGACIDQNGILTPSFTPFGEIEVTYTFDGFCGDQSSITLDWIETLNAEFDIPENICTSIEEIDLITNSEGGQWEGICPGCLDNDQLFPDQIPPGTYQLTYEFGGNCPSSSTQEFTIDPQLSAEFTLPPSICSEALPLSIVPTDFGGDFTSSCDGCISNNGNFTPEDDLGLVDITYTIPGACGDTFTASFEVINNDDASFDDPLSFCEGFGEVPMTGVIENGGDWSADCGDCIDPSTGTFNTIDLAPGVYSIDYEISGICGSLVSNDIQIIPNTISSSTSPPGFCVDVLSSDLLPDVPGGTWSADCNNCIDPNNGSFLPGNAGVGT
ncbi:MAG: hypothetical protein AAF193_01970, partial [Bacteroidota bacterium]